MKPMRLFLDTHDRTRNTFPAQLSVDDFKSFYAGYEEACRAEGVIPLQVHVGYETGRAFCLNLAPDAEAVKRAHERAGLPFDSITEVTTASPQDMFLRRAA
ncbi:MAG: DUF4242 domain-containing protein [Sterolibacteriaceae bacterium MAG5]|nr:DUF4242 domain-containing protein [Candidatus Nitricoxidireducens bremensis]